MSLESSRSSYERGTLDESSIDVDPMRTVRAWLDEAYALPSAGDANAMCLSTAGADGAPSSRIVLARGVDQRGIVFYTSYFSRKGRELEANPRAAALFHWPALERQVRIEGTVTLLSEDESDAYFASRPRGHQLSAWASEQSEPVERRETLEERMLHFDERFEGEEVPRPHSWGGYLLQPHYIEFWQGRANRLHDRLTCALGNRGWSVRRLQP